MTVITNELGREFPMEIIVGREVHRPTTTRTSLCHHQLDYTVNGVRPVRSLGFSKSSI